MTEGGSETCDVVKRMKRQGSGCNFEMVVISSFIFKESWYKEMEKNKTVKNKS